MAVVPVRRIDDARRILRAPIQLGQDRVALEEDERPWMRRTDLARKAVGKRLVVVAREIDRAAPDDREVVRPQEGSLSVS